MSSLKNDLQIGLTLTDTTGRRVLYRFIQPADNIDAITMMLHEA